MSSGSEIERMHDSQDGPMRSSPGLGSLHELDAALHALYAARGRMLLEPIDAAARVDEVIVLIEAVIPELRAQLLGMERLHGQRGWQSGTGDGR